MIKQELIHQLREIFWEFTKFFFVTLLFILLLRIFQYLLISSFLTLPDGLAGMEGLGLIQDMWLWILVMLVLLIPYTLIALISRPAGIIFFSSVFILCVTAEILLFYYFLFSLNLLDHIVYSYTLSELKMIAFSSGDVNLQNFMPVIIGIPLIIAGIYFGRKLKLRNRILLVVPMVILPVVIVLLNLLLIPQYRGTYEDSVRQNKTSYFLIKCFEYKTKSVTVSSDEEIRLAAERFHRNFPERKYSGPMYPFLYSGEQENVLAPFFTLGDEKPNLVFVIVESLSSCFMGKDAYCGSYTPFLDSLAERSLFWPNFLSTSERTFNVLPAIFGSLPPLNHNLISETGNFPQHLSSIRLLQENGYHPSFFYGGWTGFDNMGEFLKMQEVKTYIHSFGKKYHKIIAGKNYKWGHHDDEVYSRSFEIIDSLRKLPRIDIYLTLSTHEPFSPPGRDYYRTLAKERIKWNGKRKMSERFILKNLDIFASILYMDRSLADFIREYETRPDFSNTIFIITGDHGMTELNMKHYSELEKFHVPLLIYSPMLRRSRMMPAVSSHLDITPAILALINTRYGIQSRKYSAWMGDGLDTSVVFRSNKNIAFLGGNRDIMEYLKGTKFLFHNTVYDLYPGMYLRKSNDKTSRENLSQLSKDVTLLTTYVVRQDKLMPLSVYAGRYIKSIRIPVPDTSYFRPNDSTSRFRNLVRGLRVPADIKHIELKISMEMLNNATKFSKVVFDLCDTNGKSLSWNVLNITRNGIYGRWVPCRISAGFDISNIPPGKGEYLVKLYIWNNEGSHSMFRNPKVELTGFSD